MDFINLLIGLGSLLLALCAWYKARGAQEAVKTFRNQQRILHITLALERAVQQAREIQDSSAARWSKGRCDAIRETIVEWQDDPLLTALERRRLRLAIAEFSAPRENDEGGKAWIREFTDDMIRMRRRLLTLVEDSLI